jgi:curved DNA-binding protein CbpA
MREYYSVLGINKNASESEIISAYRKLSAKFHPDANGNDPFFAERYRELQEAYNMLINPSKRSAYDASLDPKFAQTVEIVKDKEKPIITFFEISKKSISESEPVTLRWQTIHASEIQINLIGNVEAEGTKTLRIPFENKEFLRIAINAKNGFLNETASKFIEIKNKDFDETKHVALPKQDIIKEHTSSDKKVENKVAAKEFKKEEQSKVAKEIKEKKSKTVERKAEESEKRKERPLTKEERLAGITIAYEDESVSKSFKKSDLYVYIVLIVLLVFVVMMLIFAYSLNPVV